MNPTIIEQAFSQAVAPSLDLPRLRGMDWRVTETDEPCLIAAIENAERVAGPFWKATLRIRLEFPALYNGADAAQYFADASSAVQAWIGDPANVSGVSLPEGRIAGSHVQAADMPAPQDNRLSAEFAIVIGWAA